MAVDMKFSYIRPTKMLRESAQRKALEPFGPFDEEYLDERPKRGAAGWFWLGKLALACRTGSGDVIHISHASVLGATAEEALRKLSELADREAVLVVAATGERYTFHPDAASGLAFAAEVEREARAAIQRKAVDAWKLKADDIRRAKMAHWTKTKNRWLKELDTSGAKIAAEQGYSRAYLNAKLGPRGTRKFVGGKKEKTS